MPGEKEITRQQLEGRIQALDAALREAAREKFPDGTATDFVRRNKAIERWVKNAYRTLAERATRTS